MSFSAAHFSNSENDAASGSGYDSGGEPPVASL